MSARKTGDRAIHVSAGTFPTYEDAVKEANAIKIWLTRLCRRKGYSCKATIGVSKNNPHTGEVTREKTGRRGRPRNVFVRTNGAMVPTGTAPHLHIIIHGNPAETLAREIAEHLNKKYGRRVAWVKNCSAYVETVKQYIAKQSLKTRTVDCWNGDRYCNEQEDGFLFTPAGAAGTRQTAEESRLGDVEQAADGLQYKANYNFLAALSENYTYNMPALYTYPIYRDSIDIYTAHNIHTSLSPPRLALASQKFFHLNGRSLLISCNRLCYSIYRQSRMKERITMTMIHHAETMGRSVQIDNYLNSIILGDSVDVMKKLPSKSVDLFVTSPPYNLKNSTGNGMKDGRGGKWENAALQNGYVNHTDDMPYNEYVKWQRNCLRQMMRLLKDDGAIFYNHKWRVQAGLMQDRHEIVKGFPVRQIIIWHRKGGINFNAGYFLPTYEVIYLIAKPNFKLAKGANKVGDVWEIMQESKNPHPAPFPEELIDRIVSSTKAEVIVDPFGGSGTTAVSTQKLQRKFIYIDNSADYCEMARKRIDGEDWQDEQS